MDYLKKIFLISMNINEFIFVQYTSKSSSINNTRFIIYNIWSAHNVYEQVTYIII